MRAQCAKKFISQRRYGRGDLYNFLLFRMKLEKRRRQNFKCAPIALFEFLLYVYDTYVTVRYDRALFSGTVGSRFF